VSLSFLGRCFVSPSCLDERWREGRRGVYLLARCPGDGGLEVDEDIEELQGRGKDRG